MGSLLTGAEVSEAVEQLSSATPGADEIQPHFFKLLDVIGLFPADAPLQQCVDIWENGSGHRLCVVTERTRLLVKGAWPWAEPRHAGEMISPGWTGNAQLSHLRRSQGKWPGRGVSGCSRSDGRTYDPDPEKLTTCTEFKKIKKNSSLHYFSLLFLRISDFILFVHSVESKKDIKITRKLSYFL